MDIQIPKPLIIAISFLQGIALTFLYQSVEQDLWPATQPVWLVSLTTLAISLPLLTLFCLTTSNIKQTIKYIIPYSLVLSLLGAYVGYQQEPQELITNSGVIGVFCFTALLASFKALMYIQQYISQQKVSYSALFKLSWRNFIIFSECWIFVGIFWGILHLGAALFATLKIDFFQELLRKDWFVIPVLNLAFGFAIIVFRNIAHTAENISTILQTLIKFLLPVLTIVSFGFLFTLPFTGLTPLWKTGSGSLWLMWLQALTLFFVNAVYQNESHERPYHPLLHRLVFIGVALLPIYSLISAYGLWLRIDQYGLTVSRCWGVLVWALLACFSFGYLAGILKKRDAWLETLNSINIAMGLVVLVCMLLVNSPLLNFQQIAATSQVARLESGKEDFVNFDYNYFARSLGRQGYLAMQELKEKSQQTSPKTAAIIERMYVDRRQAKTQRTLSQFKKSLTLWPTEQSFTEDFFEAIYKEYSVPKWPVHGESSYYAIAKDLNRDGKPEYIVIVENIYNTTASMWLKSEEGWQSNYMATSNPIKTRYLKAHLNDEEVQAVKQKWDKLKIGDLEFTPTHR